MRCLPIAELSESGSVAPYRGNVTMEFPEDVHWVVRTTTPSFSNVNPSYLSKVLGGSRILLVDAIGIGALYSRLLYPTRVLSETS